MTAASTLPPGQGGRAARARVAVRVVCFDLGGTLVRVDGHPTTRKAADLLGISLDEARGWRAGESKRRRMTPAELAEALASDFGRADIRSDLEAVFEAARQRAAVPQLFDEVEPVLCELRRRGYLLYGLSNALGSSAPASTPPCYGLLDAVMASYDIGWCKPEEQAFRIVQEAAGAEPSELLHIGDSPSTDVAGALAALRRATGGAGGVVALTAPPQRPDADLRTLTALPVAAGEVVHTVAQHVTFGDYSLLLLPFRGPEGQRGRAYRVTMPQARPLTQVVMSVHGRAALSEASPGGPGEVPVILQALRPVAPRRLPGDLAAALKKSGLSWDALPEHEQVQLLHLIRESAGPEIRKSRVTAALAAVSARSRM